MGLPKQLVMPHAPKQPSLRNSSLSARNSTVSSIFWKVFLFSWMHQPIINVGYYPPRAQIVSTIGNFPQHVKIFGEMIKKKKKQRRELETQKQLEWKEIISLFPKLFCRKFSLATVSRHWDQPSIRDKQWLEWSLCWHEFHVAWCFVCFTHNSHFCILYVFFTVLSKAMFWLHLRLPIRGQGFCR